MKGSWAGLRSIDNEIEYEDSMQFGLKYFCYHCIVIWCRTKRFEIVDNDRLLKLFKLGYSAKHLAASKALSLAARLQLIYMLCNINQQCSFMLTAR